MGERKDSNCSKGDMVSVISTNPSGDHPTQLFLFFFSYLIPCQLRWELPVEQVILVQAETFVDQSVLRETRGGRRRRRVRRRAADGEARRRVRAGGGDRGGVHEEACTWRRAQGGVHVEGKSCGSDGAKCCHPAERG